MLKLSKKYWIAILCKLFMITTSFVITIFINRGLGVTNKGEYAYVINLVEMFYVIFSVGLGQTYATFKRFKGEWVKGDFVALSLIHVVLIIIVGCFVVFFTQPKYGIAIVFLTALAVEKVIISMIAVIEESIKRNIIYSIINTIYLALLGILYFRNAITLNVVFICYALNDLLSIIVYLFSYKLKPKFSSFSFEWFKEIYRTGFITMVVMLLISVNYHIDTIMLKKMSTSYYVGLYSVGVNLSNMFLLIPDAFKEVLFGDSTKKNFARSTALNSIKVSLLTSVLILVGFVFLGKAAIIFFYGVEYLQSYYLTLVLFIGSLSMIFFKILQPIYISHGNQMRAALFLACSAVANIGANLLLIPKYNALGAAIASAISYTVCGGLFIIDYIKSFDKNHKEE